MYRANRPAAFVASLTRYSLVAVSHFFSDERLVPLDERHSDDRGTDSLDKHLQSMDAQGKLTKTEGTWCFWSPEMCKSEPFSGYSADIWAAGICLYVFVTGELPFYSEIPTELFDMIEKAEIEYPSSISDDLKVVLKAILNSNPSARSSIGDLLNKPFLDEAKTNRAAGEHGENLKQSSGRRVSVHATEIEQAVSLKKAPLGQMLSSVGRGLSSLGRKKSVDSEEEDSDDEGTKSLVKKRKKFCACS